MRLSALIVVAVLGVAVAAGGAAGRVGAHRVDLVTGSVDGHQILGRTVADVTAGFGPPDFRLGTPTRYRIGWGTPQNFRLEVLFWRSGRVLRAWSIVFESGAVHDTKIGDVLERTSPALQAAILADYGKTFKLVHPYACDRAGRCRGEFVARSGPVHLSFGTQRRTGTYLTVWRGVPA